MHWLRDAGPTRATGPTAGSHGDDESHAANAADADDANATNAAETELKLHAELSVERVSLWVKIGDLHMSHESQVAISWVPAGSPLLIHGHQLCSWHKIRLGRYEIGSFPPYLLRQTLAIDGYSHFS